MAGDLVRDPKTPQTVEHDLESDFWVLLWVCLLYMKSNMNEGDRSGVIKNIMSPPVHSGSGGTGKISFLTSPVPMEELETETSPAMAKLLIRLHEFTRQAAYEACKRRSRGRDAERRGLEQA